MGLVAISKTTHRDKALSPHRNFFFAGELLVTQICDFELQHMTGSIPLLFMRSHNSVQFCGLLGLQTGKNLMVKPDGSWRGRFIPAMLSRHPFSIVKLNEGGQTIAFDEEGEFIVDRDQGYNFFEEDGSTGEVIKHFSLLLSRITHSLPRVKKACSIIDDLDLFKPFDHPIKKSDGETIRLEGVLSVDNEKFAKLKENQFFELQKSGAINLIYAHYFSQVHLLTLLDLMNDQNKTTSSLRDLGLNIFQGKEDDLNFNF
jgi:hypothetical protein